MAHTQKRGSNIGAMVDAIKLEDYRNRIADLMRQQKEIGEDIRDVVAMCDDAGVASRKAIRQLARESFKDQDVLRAHLGSMDMYRAALDSLATPTPLEEATDAAKERAAGRKRRRAPNKTDEARTAARLHLGEEDDDPMEIGEPAGSA